MICALSSLHEGQILISSLGTGHPIPTTSWPDNGGSGVRLHPPHRGPVAIFLALSLRPGISASAHRPIRRPVAFQRISGGGRASPALQPGPPPKRRLTAP
jgi:hypothetical protein